MIKNILKFTLIAFLVSCKKEDTGPTIYNLKVVDDFTNNPLAGCKLNLMHWQFGGRVDSTLIGYTDSNGGYQYQFNEQPAEESYYDLFVTLPNYYTENISLSQNHSTSNSLIKLVKLNVLRVFVKRITSWQNFTSEGNYVFISFGHIYGGNVYAWDGPYSLDTDTLNTEYHSTVNVPSNKNIESNLRHIIGIMFMVT